MSDEIKTERLWPLAEVAKNRLLPYSVERLRDLIKVGFIKASNIGFGEKKARWAISDSEINRLRVSFNLPPIH